MKVRESGQGGRWWEVFLMSNIYPVQQGLSNEHLHRSIVYVVVLQKKKFGAMKASQRGLDILLTSSSYLDICADPFVCGPALPINSIPGPSCRTSKFSSEDKVASHALPGAAAPYWSRFGSRRAGRQLSAKKGLLCKGCRIEPSPVSSGNQYPKLSNIRFR